MFTRRPSKLACLYCYCCLLALSCARTVVTERHEGMRPVESPPQLKLVGGEDLKQQASETAQYLKKRARAKETLTFGSCQVEVSKYRDFLENLPHEKEALESYLTENGQWYEVYGKEQWSEILLTSYFSPLYEARRRPTPPYTQAIYSIPDDLIEVRLSDFSQADLAELETDRNVIAARITEGPGVLKSVVPYFSRREIDQEKKLAGRALEIAYLKPVDAFFLQIQGSGQLRFADQSIVSVGYGAQNGYRYQSIGKFLYQQGIMDKEAINMASIESYLATLNEEELYNFLSHNPSYVFFKKLKGGHGITTSGLEVAPMRTLAVDPSFFELGSLGVLEYQHPQFSNPQDSEPQAFNSQMKVVLAHDTGGAIKGPGRADLYWGAGPQAQQSAGVIKHPARLWFIAPKGSCL